ncbi:MAG: DsbA family protein [Patescibacteria group bacterium]|mgnify:FL=1
MENENNNNSSAENKNSPLTIPVAILVAGVLIAGSVWFRTGNKIDTTATVGNKKLDKIELGNLPILGDEKAKIEIVEFGDFQCPFCGKFFMETELLIREQYIKTGKVKFVWRDFAFLGPESFEAAEAARCANDQGQFWQYHDILFNRQSGENEGAFSKDKLKGFAVELGLNQTDFDSCLDSGKYIQAVKDDTDYAKTVGVDSTPSTFVNGELLKGAVPFSNFKALIEK